MIMVAPETCNLLAASLSSSCRDTEYVTSRQKRMGKSNLCSPNLTYAGLPSKKGGNVMGNRNWAMINSGATFEALAGRLVFFEDPKAAIFGRRGKDGGQDMRSGDGTLVFQAKHHVDATAAMAIADAKKEAKKIMAYRKEGHDRYQQWKDVTHWRLVTNASFNPTDLEKWKTQVVPLFEEQGLNADCWGRPKLDALLDKYPEVERSFFQNEVRVFLTLPEVRERFRMQSPFLQYGVDTGFFGRENELAEIHRFLSSDSIFLVVHGVGGIGKTRLLIEACEEIAAEGSWQVLWANTETMLSSGTWFEGIVPERPTLLVVDDLRVERLLRVITEQLLGRAAGWKIAVVVRSPRDSAFRWLSRPGLERSVWELFIDALTSKAAEKMCADLLSVGPLASRSEQWRNAVARDLAARFSGHPVWMTLAIHLLEGDGDLSKIPQTADKLAEEYLEDIIRLQEEFPQDQVLSLLRWVALFGTVNCESEAEVGLLREGSGIDTDTTVRRMLESLVEHGGLTRRGAGNSLVELRPDILRDYVLRSWLLVDVGYGAIPIQPSDDANELMRHVADAILQGSIGWFERLILASLARTELLLRLSGQSVPLLDPLFSKIRGAVDTTRAGVRLVIARALLAVAPARPCDTVELSYILRTSSVDVDEIPGVFHSQQIGHDDVIPELAWPVFHAATGAQTQCEREQVIEELCALVELEADIATRRAGRLPNDGKRAAELLQRVIQGGPQFWSDFEDEAHAATSTRLAKAVRELATPAQAAVIEALLEPLLAIERVHIWSEKGAVHICNSAVLPDSLAWNTRKSLRDQIKSYLEDRNVPTATRVLLWVAFSKAHRNENRYRDKVSDGFQDRLRGELLSDLVFTHSVFSQREADLEELKAARDIWRWHHRFEKDPELKSIADKLEDLYLKNHLAGEFEPLLGYQGWQKVNQRMFDKAAELAASESEEGIKEFLDRASDYLGVQGVYQLNRIAQHLGAHALSSKSTRAFVMASLEKSPVSRDSNFAIETAASWVMELRKREGSEAAHRLVVELMNVCASDEQRLRFLEQVYDCPPLGNNKDPMTAEYDYLRSLVPLFLDNAKGPEFIRVTGWAFHHEWLYLKALLERTLDEVPSEQVGAAVSALVRTVYWAMDENHLAPVPHDLGLWLADQLLRAPDLDVMDEDIGWHIEEVLKKAGYAPISWLPGALKKRLDMEAREGYGKVRAVGHRMLLIRCVHPITQAQAGDVEIAMAIADLVDLVWDTGMVGYYLPRLLQKVEPHGYLVPEKVVCSLGDMSDVNDVRRLARIAGAYDIGSEAWRTIAKPIIECAAHLPSLEQRYSLFRALTPHGMRIWESIPGEVPQTFVKDVESACELLETETDAEFRPFWEWNLEVAKAKLERQREYAREERGV